MCGETKFVWIREQGWRTAGIIERGDSWIWLGVCSWCHDSRFGTGRDCVLSVSLSSLFHLIFKIFIIFTCILPCSIWNQNPVFWEGDLYKISLFGDIACSWGCRKHEKYFSSFFHSEKRGQNRSRLRYSAQNRSGCEESIHCQNMNQSGRFYGRLSLVRILWNVFP